MKFSYSTVERTVMSGPDRGKKKTYAVLSYSSKKTLREIAELISYRTRLHAIDIERMIRELTHVLKDEMERGNIVDLEGLGSFRPMIRCRAAHSPEEFTKRNIEKVVPCFRTGKGIAPNRDRLVQNLHRKFRYPSHWNDILRMK